MSNHSNLIQELPHTAPVNNKKYQNILHQSYHINDTVYKSRGKRVKMGMLGSLLNIPLNMPQNTIFLSLLYASTLYLWIKIAPALSRTAVAVCGTVA